MNARARQAAGLTGAIAGAPQAMAFAILAGVSPSYGLYAAFVPTVIGALFCVVLWPLSNDGAYHYERRWRISLCGC